ncbi:hypothetical protein GCM10020331_000690 [Ectobacillus funiculus]
MRKAKDNTIIGINKNAKKIISTYKKVLYDTDFFWGERVMDYRDWEILKVLYSQKSNESGPAFCLLRNLH